MEPWLPRRCAWMMSRSVPVVLTSNRFGSNSYLRKKRSTWGAATCSKTKATERRAFLFSNWMQTKRRRKIVCMLLGFVDKAIIPLSPSNSAITIGTQTF
jgi:hypothetical protein